MQRNRFFLLALICGLIAAGSMYIYLNGATQDEPPGALKSLVVVKTNIPARSVIMVSQLEVKKVPVQDYPQGGFSKVEKVVGSVALLNLSKGDIVVSPMLKRPNSLELEDRQTTGNTTGLTVPDGKRALTIPIGLLSGVAYAVKPGDYVDILLTMEMKRQEDTKTDVTATTLAAQDVLVLSIGVPGGKASVEPKSYTLALSVPQAMAITYAGENGGILRLLLRNPADTEILQEDLVTGDVFLDPNYSNRFK